MKSGPEIVKAGLRSFFESAADDIEKMVENLKLGKVSKGNQVPQEAAIQYITCSWELRKLFWSELPPAKCHLEGKKTPDTI